MAAAALNLACGAAALADVGADTGVSVSRTAQPTVNPDHIMVRTREGVTPDQVKTLDARTGVQEVTWTSRLVPGLRCVRVGAGGMNAALAALRADPLVRYADPDY